MNFKSSYFDASLNIIPSLSLQLAGGREALQVTNKTGTYHLYAVFMNAYFIPLNGSILESYWSLHISSRLDSFRDQNIHF